jgi:hypothetical protein
LHRLAQARGGGGSGTVIIGVAFRLPDGRLRVLPRPARHCHYSREYNDEARKAGYFAPWEGWGGGLAGIEQGFVDDAGNFLNRKDAAKHAYECGQIPELALTLYSEDVW